MRFEKFITRQMLKDEPNTLFVFGDNMAREGYGGQAAEMRGEPNAVGIPTKWTPSNNRWAFFADKDLKEVKIDINEAFIKLFCHASQNGEIVWPQDGIGTGLADLKNKAPAIWDYIEDLRKCLELV